MVFMQMFGFGHFFPILHSSISKRTKVIGRKENQCLTIAKHLVSIVGVSQGTILLVFFTIRRKTFFYTIVISYLVNAHGEIITIIDPQFTFVDIWTKNIEFKTKYLKENESWITQTRFFIIVEFISILTGTFDSHSCIYAVVITRIMGFASKI